MIALLLAACLRPDDRELRGGGWTDVSVTGPTACLLRDDGRARCRSTREHWVNGWASDEVDELVAQYDGACVLQGGDLTCDTADVSASIEGPFRRLGGGLQRTCVVDDLGAVVCGDEPAVDGPGGDIVDLDADDDVCVVLADGSAACWDFATERWRTWTPAERLEEVHVSGTEATACFRDEAGTVWCTASTSLSAPAVAAEALVAFDVHDEGWGSAAYGCGLTAAGAIRCFSLPLTRLGADAAREVLTEVPAGDGYRAVAVGDDRACALTSDGHAVCWGRLEDW